MNYAEIEDKITDPVTDELGILFLFFFSKTK